MKLCEKSAIHNKNHPTVLMLVSMIRQLKSFVLLSGLVLAQTGLANYSLSLLENQEAYWESQRADYKNTVKLLRKGQRQLYQERTEALSSYPLYPYLKYKEYSRYISSVDKEEVDEFIHEYGDSPLAGWLRKKWIKNLTLKKDWDTYLANYRLGQYSTEYDCYYYWALYKEGDRNSAFMGARKLWLVGKSQHKACDPLFEVWKTTGEMQGDLAWERTALAIENRKLQLAKYLENHVPKKKKRLAREWRDVYRDPKRLKYMARYQKWGDDAKPVIITGFNRLIRKDEALAQKLWPQYMEAFNFNAAERAKVASEFAYVLGIRKHEGAEYWLSQAAQYQFDPRLNPIGLRHALYEQDWSRMRIWLAMLDEDTIQEETWQYWKARTELNTGTVDLNALSRVQIDSHRIDVLNFHNRFINSLTNGGDFMELLPQSVIVKKFLTFEPEQTFQQLAQSRNYYGFLSSERLNQPLNLNIETTQVREEDLNRITQLPAVQRARELFLMGEINSSRSEWQYLVRRSNEYDRSVLAHLAYIWGWHHPAIIAAYQSDAYNNLEIRFPTAYQGLISKHAQKSGLELDWVYSLIRQESAFMYNASSAVGAVGMMQIMPRTAKQLSRNLGIANPGKYGLLKPDANVRLGTHYMSQLLKQFDGNIILATAAYNAGPHRAKAWRPKHLPVSGDIWVETIPFSETRDYVKNILTYQAIYRHHLGKEVKLSSALKAIHPKFMQVGSR